MTATEQQPGGEHGAMRTRSESVARLYGMKYSHAVLASRMALELTGVRFEAHDLFPGLHGVLVRAKGFPAWTVPALLLDGRRVQGSLAIARELDRLVPAAGLFPGDADQRGAVEEAERFGHDELQALARRVLRWAGAHEYTVRVWMARELIGAPAPALAGHALRPFTMLFARVVSKADGARVRDDLSRLPGLLDRADALLADGTIGGEAPNAADLQILTSIRLLMAHEDLRAAIAPRPCGEAALSLIPDYPRAGPDALSSVPASLPRDWLPPGIRRVADRPPQERWGQAADRPPGTDGSDTAAADSEELRLRRSVLVMSSVLIAGLACIWVVTFALLGLWVSAAIPFAYQVASVLGICTFARTRRYRLFRRSQLWLCLALPFALQWSLGGFGNASAVCLWAFSAPVGALLFIGTRQAVPWLVAFVTLVVVSGALDPALAADAPHIPSGIVIVFFVLNVAGVTSVAYVLLHYFVGARDREHARSERLLLNVLPAPVAGRLKQGEAIIADACPDVTVLFADIVGFTPLSERLPAAELVAVLDRVFTAWDQLAAHHHVEKIKTIGDAYMVAGGLPVPRENHAEAIAELALAMGPAVTRVARETGLPLRVRIGIDTGPVVAGVIGRAKFIYDLWGDTVTTASRMESHALAGTIQVTPRTHDRLRKQYELRPRGTIEVKGKGPMRPYLLIGPRDRRPSLVAEVRGPGGRRR